MAFLPSDSARDLGNALEAHRQYQREHLTPENVHYIRWTAEVQLEILHARLIESLGSYDMTDPSVRPDPMASITLDDDEHFDDIVEMIHTLIHEAEPSIHDRSGPAFYEHICVIPEPRARRSRTRRRRVFLRYSII